MTDSNQDSSVVAVVLAGGGAQDPLAKQAGVEAKALAPFEGKPLGLYVLEALRACRGVSDCIYIGPSTEVLAPYAGHVLPAGDSLTDSLTTGLRAALTLTPGARRVLVVTADLPWLSAGAIDDVLERAPDAAFVYPIISRKNAEAQFPAQTRTYATLKEGTFTGGNLILLQPRIIPRLLPLVHRFYRARKNPFAMAAVLGPGILWGFLSRRLGIATLEARVSSLLGAEARAFETPYANLGADVDKLEHLAAMQPGAPLGLG